MSGRISPCIVAVILILANSLLAEAQTTINPNTDRRASDDSAMTLPPVRATVGNCLRLCMDDSTCRAFTFVANEELHNCWLSKNPSATPRDSGCCSSGAVR